MFNFLPKKPGRPKKEPTPPPGHENMMAGLRRSLAIPKAEIDRREQAWREREEYRGKNRISNAN